MHLVGSYGHTYFFLEHSICELLKHHYFTENMYIYDTNRNAKCLDWVQFWQSHGKDVFFETVVLISRFFDEAVKSTYYKLMKEAAKLKSGSKEPGRVVAGSITMKQAEAIAKEKMKDLNAFDIKEATKIICGSARSMGIEVKE